MQIGLNIPLTNVYIFGYDIGYNIQRDDLSFIIFSSVFEICMSFLFERYDNNQIYLSSALVMY